MENKPIVPKKKVEKTVFWMNLPVELKRQFKSYCAKRGTNMTKSVKRYMRNCIDGSDKLKGEDVKGTNRYYGKS